MEEERMARKGGDQQRGLPYSTHLSGASRMSTACHTQYSPESTTNA